MQTFDASHKTIYNWFGAWETSKLVGLYDRTGREQKPTFTPEQKEQIKQWVNQSPKQLQQVLQNIVIAILVRTGTFLRARGAHPQKCPN